ncbi:hypothetical protein DL98DRAFT_587258 [Cadophora sp. DSE1049]|nr:hypothetical protein DL98DRAFT_587258 [Cadophora sp. DSE1049]
MDETMSVIHIQSAASGPVYQIKIAMQPLDDDHIKTQHMQYSTGESLNASHPARNQAPLKEFVGSRDSEVHTTSPPASVEAVESTTEYGKFKKRSFERLGGVTIPEPKTAIEQEEHDKVQRDMAEIRMEMLHSVPKINKEEQEKEMARLDAEIEELTRGIGEIQALARATVDELNRCCPACRLKVVEMDLFDDHIHVSRLRINRIQ